MRNGRSQKRKCKRSLKTYENTLSHPRFQEDANPRTSVFMSACSGHTAHHLTRIPRGHLPSTLCVTSTTWVSRLWPRDTYWGTSRSSATVKWKVMQYCFAVYQELANNRKQQLNAHVTLKVFRSPWKTKTCQITAKSKGNTSGWSHASFVFLLGWQYLSVTFRFKANGVEIQTWASKIFSRERGEGGGVSLL